MIPARAPLPDLFTAGPQQHGVVRYASEIARAGRATGAAVFVVESVDDIRPGHPLHVHFTDRLFGASPEEAATAFERLTSIAPITVTLHDVPQPSDGAVNLPRRGDCYRRVLEASAGAVCNSAHERTFLLDLGIEGPGPEVIPLAVDEPEVIPPAVDSLEPVAALVGFVYPGKGHREVIDAVAGLGRGLDIVALGAASAGHEHDLAALAHRATDLGVRFTATGFLSDSELLRRCASVAVPIAAHQHISASGSILAWLSAGRRPLVVDSRYTREMLALRPETMTLFPPDLMDVAISRALDEPASTMLAPGVSTAPQLRDAFADYVRWWREGAT